MNTTEESIDDSGRGSYSDYIEPTYVYSRQYMVAADYQKRIRALALKNVGIGHKTIRLAMKYETNVSKRIRPGTEHWQRPVFQIMDDEITLRTVISHMFNIQERSSRRKWLHYKDKWDVWIDDFLADKPTIEVFLPHMDHRASVNMESLIPIHEVMASGDLPWPMCYAFVKHVSIRMSAYAYANMKKDLIQKGKPVKFWHTVWFHNADIIQKLKPKPQENADNG